MHLYNVTLQKAGGIQVRRMLSLRQSVADETMLGESPSMRAGREQGGH